MLLVHDETIYGQMKKKSKTTAAAVSKHTSGIQYVHRSWNYRIFCIIVLNNQLNSSFIKIVANYFSVNRETINKKKILKSIS